MSDSESDRELWITQTPVGESTPMPENVPDFTLKNSDYSDISSDDNEELVKISQEVEKKISEEVEAENLPENNRFVTLTDDKIDEILDKTASKKTQAKDMWALRLFNAWKTDRNKKAVTNYNISRVNGELLFMTEEDLNTNLQKFITEIRKVNGEEYRGNTLFEIIASLQHYMRQKNRKINLFDGQSFTGLNNVLDAKMKRLAQKGIGTQKRQAKVINEEQEEKLWQLKLLGTDTPQQLLDTLLYVLGLNFALRAGQEHRNLRTGPNSQLQILRTENGRKYIQYNEDVSKCNSGGLHNRKMEAKCTRVYENTDMPHRCPVAILEKYLGLRPKDGKCNALYLRPRKYPTDDTWYSDSPVGVNLLTQTIGRICQQAGFQGFYSNHSLRATAATRLFIAGVDEQLITGKTGHKSLAVKSYKRLNDKQLEDVSDILQPTKKGRVREFDDNNNEINVQNASDVPSTSGQCKEISINSGSLKINMKF